MRGWNVVLRGIAYRPGRSLIVLVLAAMAVAAAVLAPTYTRAAQQSVLRDALRAAPASASGLTVSAQGTAAAAPPAHELSGEIRTLINGEIARRRSLGGLFGQALAGVDTETVVADRAEPLAARLAYRDGLCAHVRIDAGNCPVDAGEVLLSSRSAREHKVPVRDKLTLNHRTASGPRPHQVRVVGFYTPLDAAAAYWGQSGYFAAGATSGEASATRIDAIFAGAEDDVRAEPDGTVSLRLEYPLRVDALGLDAAAAVRGALGPLGSDLRARDLELTTALPTILAAADSESTALTRTVPLIGVPLLLLALFVLFLLVAALIEERSAELALARLRGLWPRQATRFALGEILLLVVLAAPVGVLIGLGLVSLVTRLALAAGTPVELRAPVFAGAAGAVFAVWVAAGFAARRTLGRPILALLRRVPARRPWAAGLIEGIILALAAVALLAAFADRTAPLALLAGPLLAVVTGIAVGRLLAVWARTRVPAARSGGNVVTLLAAAQLARRPGAHRIVAVVTVAVAVLAFAATAWDVASQARQRHAAETVGAARVYAVTAAHPEALVAALAQVDPDGTAMAVVRSEEQFADGRIALLGVQSPALATVAVWPGQADMSGLATALRPAAPAPLTVAGRLEVAVDVDDLTGATVRLAAVVQPPGEPPTAVDLGELKDGRDVLSARLPACPAACRLLGFSLVRDGGGVDEFEAEVALGPVRTAAGSVPTAFDDRASWRVLADRAPRAEVELRPGPELGVRVTSRDPGDVVIEYRDTPDALPVALAGPAPTDDPAARTFRFAGLTQNLQSFTVARRVPALPRAGRTGLLFDLDYAVRVAGRTAGLADNTQLRYEVWATAGAPADLDRRLAGVGIGVLRVDTMDGELTQAGRRAPALGFRLYLLAGVVALLLAFGAVLFAVAVAAPARRSELAALHSAGVRGDLLRRAVLREHLALLGLPTIGGFAVGVAAAVLMLPGSALVTAGEQDRGLAYHPAFGALPVAAGACLLGVAAALVGVRRLLRDRPPRSPLGPGWRVLP